MSKVQKRRKRYRFTTRFYGIITALIVIIVGVILSRTLFFNITDIVFENTSPYSLEEIQSVAQVTKGDNLFSMNLTKRSENLEKALPYAGEVKMSRKLPSTLKIKIVAPTPLMNIQTADGYYYLVSDEDKVLEKNLTEAVAGYTVIFGYEPCDVKVCDKIYSTDSDKKELVDNLFETFKKNGFEHLVAIDVTNINALTVKYNDFQTINLGNCDDLEFKIELAKAIIDKRGNPNEAGTINVESTQYPTFIGEHNGVSSVVTQ